MRVSQNRLRLLSIFIIVFAFLLVVKLYFVQIVSGSEFRMKAEHQYVAGVNYFDRGSIFFTAKDGTVVPGATVKTGFVLHINPIVLEKRDDLENVYELLNKITPINKEDFF